MDFLCGTKKYIRGEPRRGGRCSHRVRGIAMITVMLFLVFMMVIAALVIRAVVKGIQVSGSSRRYLSTFEAAESGIEWGMVEIERATESGTTYNDSTDISLGGKNVGVTISALFTSPVSGANIAFGGGYEGIGGGSAKGGTAQMYNVTADASGSAGEKVGVEVAYRKIVGIGAH